MTTPRRAADQQTAAWGYYGWPGSGRSAIGEVRYVVGWIADQMKRLDWTVTIDGMPDWTVTLDDGERITTGDDPAEASARLLDLIDWRTNVAAVAENLFVAGAGDYVLGADGRWRVVSAIAPKRSEILKRARLSTAFLWPHPADPSTPNAPLFGVLDVLDELDWLQRQSRTQSRQRVLTSGVVVTADTLTGPDGTDFWDEWNRSLSARMLDPDDLSPVRLQAPAGTVSEAIHWTRPPIDYDAMVDRRIAAAIQRLAYGLPLPPEILLGMQAQSRATAFQVEENAYRAHIEPPAQLLELVASAALDLVLDDVEVAVRADPSRMLARRHSVQDVTDAYDRGEVSGDYYRHVLGIPEDAEPTPEERERREAARRARQAPRDPANDAADEAVNASAHPDQWEGQEVSSVLAQIDAALTSELQGATVMAVDRARQRLGAAARSNATVRANADLKGLSSAQVATALGLAGLEAAGVDIAAAIAEPVDSLSRWWARRFTDVLAQVQSIIPGYAVQGDWLDESLLLLADGMSEHIIESLGDGDPAPLPSLPFVLDAATGGGRYGVQ